MSGLVYLPALLAALAWGVTFVPLKKTVAPTSLGVVYSMAAGVISYLLIAGWQFAARGMPEMSFSGPGAVYLFLNGITQFLCASLFYYAAVRHGEISVVAPMTRLKTVIVIAILVLFRLETVTAFLVLACAAGLAGGYFLACSPGRRPIIRGDSRQKGVFYALGAAFFWGVGEIFTGRALVYYPPLATSFLSVCVGMACYLAWLAARGRLKALVSLVPPRDRKLFFCHGVLNYGVGYYFFFIAIAAVGVGRASIIVSAWPLISALLGVVIYREGFHPAKGIGIFLLLASVFLAMV